MRQRAARRVRGPSGPAPQAPTADNKAPTHTDQPRPPHAPRQRAARGIRGERAAGRWDGHADPTARLAPERGSSLLLLPAGILVVVLLGAVAIDLSAAHLAQRQLTEATERAASDAAAMLDRDAIRSGDGPRLEADAARDAVAARLAATRIDRLDRRDVAVSIAPDGRGITVVVTARVDRIFGTAIPGVPRTTNLHTTVTARLE